MFSLFGEGALMLKRMVVFIILFINTFFALDIQIVTQNQLLAN